MPRLHWESKDKDPTAANLLFNSKTSVIVFKIEKRWEISLDSEQTFGNAQVDRDLLINRLF